MVHDLLEVVRVQGVEDVEEVVTRWSLAGWVLVGEVRHEDRVLLELRIQSLDGQLIVMWHYDILHLYFLEELLLTNQDILKEIFVDKALGWQIELEAVMEKIGEMLITKLQRLMHELRK